MGGWKAINDVRIGDDTNMPKIKLSDGIVSGQARIDAYSEALQVIDFAHHTVHEGDHYFVEGYADLNNGDVLNIRVVTPDTSTWVHLLFNIESSLAFTTQLYEDASGWTGGTSLTPVNNNRNSANTSAVQFIRGVTGGSDGTLISQGKWGTKKSGGGLEIFDEIILKQGTTYLRRFTSNADSNVIYFRASWYECASRN